jgi:hypothetical protein
MEINFFCLGKNVLFFDILIVITIGFTIMYLSILWYILSIDGNKFRVDANPSVFHNAKLRKYIVIGQLFVAYPLIAIYTYKIYILDN